jgi:hypothetical protein
MLKQKPGIRQDYNEEKDNAVIVFKTNNEVARYTGKQMKECFLLY